MMPHDPRNWQADLRSASVAREDLESPSDDSDAGARGRRIATSLFSAGMDVQFALMVAGDGPGCSCGTPPASSMMRSGSCGS